MTLMNTEVNIPLHTSKLTMASKVAWWFLIGGMFLCIDHTYNLFHPDGATYENYVSQNNLFSAMWDEVVVLSFPAIGGFFVICPSRKMEKWLAAFDQLGKAVVSRWLHDK